MYKILGWQPFFIKDDSSCRELSPFSFVTHVAWFRKVIIRRKKSRVINANEGMDINIAIIIVSQESEQSLDASRFGVLQ